MEHYKTARSGNNGKPVLDRFRRSARCRIVCGDAGKEGHELLRGHRKNAKDRGQHPCWRKRLPEAAVHHRVQGVCCGVHCPSDYGLCHRRPDVVQVHPLRLCYRRRVLHAGRLHRHEDRHQLQRPYRAGRFREPEQGPAGGLLLRLRHGLHRGWPGHAGHYHVVLHPALCLRY